MAKENKKFKKRLFQVSKELNVAVDTLVEHLQVEGFTKVLEGTGINASIVSEEAYQELLEAFAADRAAASRVKEKRTAIRTESEEQEEAYERPAVDREVSTPKPEPQPEKPAAPEVPEHVELPPVEATEEEERPKEVEARPPVSMPEAEETEEVPVESQAVEKETPEPTPEPVEAGADQSDIYSENGVREVLEPESLETMEPALQEVEEETGEVVDVDQIADEVEDETVEEIEDTDLVDESTSKPVILDDGILTADRYKLAGTKVIGKIDLSSLEEAAGKKKKKRKRKRKGKEEVPAIAEVLEEKVERPGKASVLTDKDKKKRKRRKGLEIDEADIESTMQETLRELEHGAGRVRQRRRRQRREERAADRERDRMQEQESSHTIRVTEFISTGELANLLNVPVTEIISMLFKSGLMVSINQRLDADTITFVADEFGYEVEFITDFGEVDLDLEEDRPEDLQPRAPVVTVMGHVDHGKTSLLDFIRRTNVVAGEAGGITQHIGAYNVQLQDGRQITFLDTPGHEAFTAMRARGAQATDVVILVVAADDAVMPQTVEAINHAKAANVPIVVAINKIDKPEANPQRVMQQLADHNVLVEQYGGKVQASFVSAKTGEGVSDLLDKVLLEADLLELRGNFKRKATGVIIESRLEKGRGNVATVLVQNGTLRVGDPFIAGIYSGRVRAMFDERDNRVDEVGPAQPALVIGFDGAPEVGDQFVVLNEEREAREIAQRRQQIHREQALRQRKHVTLDEIGRRLALGEFRELNLIIKADVGGSVEALADSLLKLSTDEVAVNIIHSGVGAITESDVMLASASDAVIIGFQVRPIAGARLLAEREEIDIRTYSIIYKAIEDVRDALEGLLTPEETEKITGVVEVRNTFRVPKVGTVAGCYVVEGRIHRSDRIRVIRDGVVIHTGHISSLKRFKDDAREVQSGYECGLSIENFNDINIGDQIESFEIVETKRKLER